MKTYHGKIVDREILIKALVGLAGGIPLVRANALIDTGATISGITPSLVDRLGLGNPKHQVQVQGVHGTNTADVHDVSIYLAISRAQSPSTFFLSGRDSIEVAVIDESDIDVLIGMDFLDGFHLAMFRDNFTLSRKPEMLQMFFSPPSSFISPSSQAPRKVYIKARSIPESPSSSEPDTEPEPSDG